MIMQSITVQYKNLIRWDVKSFLLPSWKWDESELVPLGSVLKRRSEEYKGVETPTLLSIHFDGELTKRKTKDLKGRVFTAHPGDVVYSKIDVRNGAIGIVPEIYGKVAFTSEFPIYEVDTAKINSLYLQLILKTSLFNKLINSLVSGSSGRKRVNPEGLEGLKIPMPSLAEQKKIFSTWRQAEEEANKLFEKAQIATQTASDSFLSSIGVKKATITRRGKVFVLRFKNLVRWDFEWTSRFESKKEENEKWQTKKLVSVLTLNHSGVWGKSPIGTNDTKVLRSTNIQNNEWVWGDTASRFITESEFKKYKLEEGDIIITKSSGSKDHIGKCAYVTKEIEQMNCAFSNFMQRIRFDKEVVHPFFGFLFVSNPYIRIKLLEASTTTTGLRNLKVDAINDLLVPLPPLAKQKEIVAKIEKMRAQATIMRHEAEKISADAKDRIEKLLIG